MKDKIINNSGKKRKGLSPCFPHY